MRLYRALLHLYPRSFRTEYGGEMCGIFARRLRDSSSPGAAALWMGALFEILFHAAAVHLDILRQDLRYTARSLTRSPGFTATAILVVALGIGANTAAFSVTDFTLLRPLPFHDSARLMKVWERVTGYSRMEVSPANYRDWKKTSTAFTGMGAFVEDANNLVTGGQPQRVQSTSVSWDLFPVLDAKPAIGRLFSEEEDRPGAPNTVVLSYSLWQNEFGGDPDILNRQITLDGAAHRVIGVMPRGFQFPNADSRLWITLRIEDENYQDRNNNYLQVIGRLKPGMAIEQARAQMDLIATQLERQNPKENLHHGVNVIPWRDEVSSQSRLLLLALSGAAFCVLLIACINLANLLLARALARQRELAVRTAIGAGRDRIVRQLITESLTLASLGGGLGILLAIIAMPVLAKLAPNGLPIADAPAIDLRVLLFAVLLTAITGLAFGAGPALQACRDSGMNALREGARSGGGRKERLRSTLVVAEVAASVVLLVSAGLLLRALWRLQAADPGFRAQNVLTLRTALPLPKYDAVLRRRQFYTQVISGVKSLPGVASAAYISFLPMAMGGGIWPVDLNGQTFDRSAGHSASLRYVTPGYFHTLGIALHQGRDVSDADSRTAPYVAVVSESFVQRYFPNENPIGRQFRFALAERTIAGIAGDVRVRGLDRESEPQVYIPYQQVKDGDIPFYVPKDLAIRVSSATAATNLMPSIRHIVHEADPEQPISNVRTMQEIVDQTTAPRALQAHMLIAFAAIAFLLAAVGIHGLLAFAVSQRTREIGVRVALGASRADIVKMVLTRSLLVSLGGILPGLALAYAAGTAIESLLAGVKPWDPETYLAAAGLCLIMTLVGSLMPSLRAARVDPVTAMRAE